MPDGIKLDATFVGEQIAMLSANWPNALKGRDASRTVAVWREGLAGLDRDAVAGAVTVIIREDEHFPRIARIRIVAREWIRRNRGEDVQRRSDGRTCPNCGEQYAMQDRWRIATFVVVGNAVAFRLTADGDAVLLEPFGRELCRCAPKSPYTPTLKTQEGPAIAIADLKPYDHDRLVAQRRRIAVTPGTPTWAKAGTAVAPAPAERIAENVAERVTETGRLLPEAHRQREEAVA
jgi:hypothetical protein